MWTNLVWFLTCKPLCRQQIPLSVIFNQIISTSWYPRQPSVVDALIVGLLVASTSIISYSDHLEAPSIWHLAPSGQISVQNHREVCLLATEWWQHLSAEGVLEVLFGDWIHIDMRFWVLLQAHTSCGNYCIRVINTTMAGTRNYDFLVRMCFPGDLYCLC